MFPGLFLTSCYFFPKQQILDCSKLKEFADDDFKFDRNDRKFSKWLEKTVGKGEIARYEQFLLFPHFFQKTCTADTCKPGLVLERVNQSIILTVASQSNYYSYNPERKGGSHYYQF